MRKILLVVLLLLSSNLLYAQSEDTTFKYWITVGGMLMFNKDLASINLNYSFSIDRNFYKVAYFSRGGVSQNPSVGNDGYLYNTIDISIGKRLQSEWFQAAFFVGPSYLFGKKELSADNFEDYDTVGLQSDVQLLFRLANEVGVGVGLYGNLNFEKNYVGANINITLGNGK